MISGNGKIVRRGEGSVAWVAIPIQAVEGAPSASASGVGRKGMEECRIAADPHDQISRQDGGMRMPPVLEDSSNFHQET